MGSGISIEEQKRQQAKDIERELLKRQEQYEHEDAHEKEMDVLHVEHLQESATRVKNLKKEIAALKKKNIPSSSLTWSKAQIEILASIDYKEHILKQTEAQLKKDLAQEPERLADKQRTKIHRWLDDTLGINEIAQQQFNRGTSEVIKYLQTLEEEWQDMFFDELFDKTNRDRRWSLWAIHVKIVLEAIDMTPDTEITAKNKDRRNIYAFHYMQRKGYTSQKLNFTQFTDVVNAVNYLAIKKGGDTGMGVWHYDK